MQFGKQHSRYKAICRPLFCYRSGVVKYTSSLFCNEAVMRLGH